MERFMDQHWLPKTIRVDNGPEFTSKRLEQWGYLTEIELDFSRLRKLTDNALNEAFNGKFRQEFLNETWFLSLEVAQEKGNPGETITTVGDHRAHRRTLTAGVRRAGGNS